MKKILTLMVVVLTSAYLQGCASGATSVGMTSTKSYMTSNNPFAKQISVDAVDGGSWTNPVWISKVGNKDMEEAVKASLRNNGLLANGNGAYILKPIIKDVDQPFVGASFTVNADVQYVLKEAASGKVVLSKTLKSSYKATMSDSFFGVKRMRIANEGAIRNNIDLLLQQITEPYAK